MAQQLLNRPDIHLPLEDERRTSNAQLRTSNQRAYRLRCWAVWMLRTKMRISSSVSLTSGSIRLGPSSGTRWASRSQR